MRWRALAVAMAGLSVWLAACSFDDAWRAYCDFPGRCSALDPGWGVLQIAQGTERQVTLSGAYLADASVTVIPASAGAVTSTVAQSTLVTVSVLATHGAPPGTQFMLRLQWDPTRDEHQDSDPLEITAINVAGTGSDDGGDGTPAQPFRTLGYAGHISGPGDTIHLAPGQYDSIYPAGAPCGDPTSGLKAGVTVEGELTDAGYVSVIDGKGTRGTCAFDLSSADQVVRRVSITGFGEGLRASDTGFSGGARPTASQVQITLCDAGVTALPGSSLLLQQVDIRQTELGLASNGADVLVQGGTISFSRSNGVAMTGDGGTLVLSGVDVNHNAETFTDAGLDDLVGAGILLGADGGTATIGGMGTLKGSVTNNGRSAVTIAGPSTTATFDGALLQANQGGTIALLVKANTRASVYLQNTTFNNCGLGIKVEDFAVFNGGTGDGGYGGNTLMCGDPINSPTNTEVWDSRGASGTAAMTFSRSDFHGRGIPPPGTDISLGSADAGWWGIQVDVSTHHVRFE